MLSQQKADVCRAVPASGTPVLHRAQRDARASCKSGLRHSGAGDQIPHGQVCQIPDDRQPLLFGVQVDTAISAILDALTAQRIEAKDAKIAEQGQQLFAAQLAASQAAQNETLKAYMSGQLAYYNPRPVPAFPVPAPYQYGNCGTGCGCNGCA